MNPRVSAILTVYKRTQYLPQALASVLAQSYADFEVIVADDSGTFASKAIVSRYADSGRVRYSPNPKTIGVAASLVQAVSQARGEFIAILNDDDVWETDLLAELVPPLEADSACVLATADHWIMDDSGRIDIELSEAWTTNFGRSQLSAGNLPRAVEFIVANCGAAINIAAVFRKNAIDWSLVVPEVKGAYDYWVACLLAATRRPIYYVPKRLARWRTHPEMETRRCRHDKGENLAYIYSTIRKRSWFPELEGTIKAKLGETLFALGRSKLHFNHREEARASFWQCFLLTGSVGALVRAGVTFLPKSVRMRLDGILRSLRTSPKVPKSESTPAEPLLRF